MKYYYRYPISLLIIFIIFMTIKNDLHGFAQHFFRYSKYLGMVICFGMSTLGLAKGIGCISKSFAGTSILSPFISGKAFVGCIICESNMLYGFVMTILIYFATKSAPGSDTLADEIVSSASFSGNSVGDDLLRDQIVLAAGIIVGMCSYFSSIAVGMICAALCVIDAKDRSVFLKMFLLEIFATSIGVLGLVSGINLLNKFKD
ncbi:V-type proton ATPase subunit c''2 [Dictyocoela muelleri]|nr:V-type proton ATPase subunit c''2 [Dictyocoela muelleri]